MSKEQKLYCKLGQAVCNVTGAIIFIAVPIIATGIAEMLSNMILGG